MEKINFEAQEARKGENENMRKTKIVCTLGPASLEDDIMRQMLLAGLDVARVNFSHGDHEGHGEMIDRFRRVRDDLGKAAAVMLDTKGPEYRIKTFQDKKAAWKARQYMRSAEAFS